MAQAKGYDIPEELDDQPSTRWKNVVLLAFGQKKMFTRPIAALLHLTIYAAFVITQIELIESLCFSNVERT